VAQQKIRIRLKGYDHKQVDKSARDIVETVAGLPGEVEQQHRQRPPLVIPYVGSRVKKKRAKEP